MRGELPTVAALLALAGLAWWSTAERMAGMNAGPGAGLGAPGWFTGVWAIMMAAMMLPSLAPTAAAYAAIVRGKPSRVLLFAGGYLLVWCAAGIAAYGLFEAGQGLLAGSLAWHSGGRWVAAGVLLLAALYQLTPTKRAFLRRCRRAPAYRQTTRRETRTGAFLVGLRNGGWCVGCSWALMGALFALGVMSLIWMVMIAVLVALEKLAPWGRGVTAASAGLLAVLAVAILAAPHEVPGFVVPAAHDSMRAMNAMG